MLMCLLFVMMSWAKQIYVLQHEIHTGDASPTCQQFRRLCPQKRQEMRNLLSEMLERDVIKPSCSPWALPVVLVKKKDGTAIFALIIIKLIQLLGRTLTHCLE